MFEAEAKAQVIKFPVKMLSGDSYESLETGTFDTVIPTHVLCSVDEVESMLETIGRLLKPGGQFVFLEHVAAKKGTLQRSFQRLTGPAFKIIAAGCEFRDLQQTLVFKMASRNSALKWSTLAHRCLSLSNRT
eukprot:GHVN01064247.1.p2 GENE.GHVN01064247.1~~GHVN01064247.1.p2  ORF type:complete len:132 (+),score=14.20 GHVN01064247.1:440-835(+)